ncbi:MAG TPA: Uma2 family endonuclease [Thermoanaerobaculia bacterium]|nr:Uma2 family endonuclease [Thermoanaerobaculia bacterium]
MATETSTNLTYEDYVNLPNDGKRYEIIDGELYVNPAPNTKHQRVVGNIWFALESYFREHRIGEVLSSPIDVVLSSTNIVEPDLIVILAENAIITERNIQGAPDIVIEVLSDSTRRIDEIAKRKLYERYGVSEYWIADPVIDTAKIYRRGASGFDRVAEISLETGGAITTPLLPGFTLAIHEVFAD